MAQHSRSSLLTLLTQAAELEHGLACSYLYAAMTLKQEAGEGLGWKAQQHTRFWAAQIYFVAAQEMLHLAQVWNLQAAIGGTPYYFRPNFPQPANFYPLNLPISAEPFNLVTLDRFISFERPAALAPARAEADPSFRTVGELYRLIAEAFSELSEAELFVGYKGRQVGPELVDFPQLVKVVDRASALEAIALIVHQGEGLAHDHTDCHYGIFQGVRRQYVRALFEAGEAGETFEPARPSLSNPVAAEALRWAGPAANPIADPRSSGIADTFDSLYGLMLRMLQYVFDNGTGDPATLSLFARMAIRIMATAVKPLGEGLTMLPAGGGYEAQTAGPGFILARHVPLPNEPAAARIVASEKLAEINARLVSLLGTKEVPKPLLAAQESLGRMVVAFDEARGG